MLNVFMLNVIMLNAIMISVIILNVVAAGSVCKYETKLPETLPAKVYLRRKKSFMELVPGAAGQSSGAT